MQYEISGDSHVDNSLMNGPHVGVDVAFVYKSFSVVAVRWYDSRQHIYRCGLKRKEVGVMRLETNTTIQHVTYGVTCLPFQPHSARATRIFGSQTYQK